LAVTSARNVLDGTCRAQHSQAAPSGDRGRSDRRSGQLPSLGRPRSDRRSAQHSARTRKPTTNGSN